MTSSDPAPAGSPQIVFGQISDLINFALPIAHRLLATGNLNQAVDEGKRMAVEALLGAMAPTIPSGPARPADGPQAGAERPGPAPTARPQGGTVVAELVTGVMPGAAYARLGLQGAQILSDLMRDHTETVQRETTKRAAITARKDVRIAEIEGVRAAMELYLKLTFDERRANFGRMFDTLDKAQAEGDLQGMQLMLSGILDLAKSSPLKDLATFKQHLDNPDFVLEL